MTLLEQFFPLVEIFLSRQLVVKCPLCRLKSIYNRPTYRDLYKSTAEAHPKIYKSENSNNILHGIPSNRKLG